MITIADIHNQLFSRFDEASKQVYVDLGNEDVVDIAKTYGIDEADIVTPWHSKLKRHACNVALKYFAMDNAGMNNDGGFVEGDVYANLFIMQRTLSQDSHNKISKVMFTGEAEDSISRAINSVRLVRG